MPSFLTVGLAVTAVAASVALTACGGGGGSATTSTAVQRSTPEVLRVPSRFKTIQRAVDASRPGDLVLVSPGVYRESVEVEEDHPRIVIRGVDRNSVVLDGGDELANGIAVQAPGVAVENLTVRRFAVNGVVWSTETEYAARGDYLDGWRGSYLTVYDNGLYGVYAFGSANGRFDHVYASGHPDSGVYVGRCKPCNALVRDSVAEHNNIGYEATNASGNVTVVGNVWRRNRIGAQINSLTKEGAAPQIGSALVANLIADNDDAKAPRGSEGFGAGVVVNGGSENRIAGNRIAGHPGAGVVVTDSTSYRARGNEVRSNAFSANRVDLVLDVPGGSSEGNCFPGQGSATMQPPGLSSLRCGVSSPVASRRYRPLRSPPQVDYRRVPAPPPQPNMPRARTAPARPAEGLPEKTDATRRAVPGG